MNKLKSVINFMAISATEENKTEEFLGTWRNQQSRCGEFKKLY